ncbi:discoidin domain-containing protein [Streptococcus zalophi]|uniref:Discoidin domain-containing protein n=1 Tax=Streptococcus zalophi TaxID=640031 RepID=A0A934PAP6_9STRE|nr:discoidin domain-containing protein [Streptococcus zalophi]MBJ8350048.1 discoidin domain-containing protein [Streptococcus zalophi]
MKNFSYYKRLKFSIRRLSVGVASVAIGASLFGVSPVLADQTETTRTTETATNDVSPLVQDETNTVADSSELTNATNDAVVLDETVHETTETPEVVTVNSAETTPEPVETTPLMATALEDNTEGESEAPEVFEKPANAVGAIDSLTFENGVANIVYNTGEKARVSLYNDHVFRYYIDKTGEFVEDPVPSREDRPAKIAIKTLEDYRDTNSALGSMSEDETSYKITTDKVQLVFDKQTARLSVFDKVSNNLITKEVLPVQITANKTTQTLSQDDNEYFFGGGMQNGRFTHKGNKINIVNENNWVDGGVASPSPFYWSTKGYGVLRNTFKRGQYDFGTEDPVSMTTTHDEDRFDAYFFVNNTPANLLKDYYELTGSPAVLPEYALYLGHLNAYNRDYWVEVPSNTRGAILLDGKYYKEYQPNQLPEADRPNAIKETLNGEGDSYKFSARAVIDRYKAMDMPLSWFLPNDGYGAGYGQTDSLDGNIQNLKSFVDYAKENGVKVGLWTQSDLYDTDPSKEVVLHRDIDKEVGEAGIRVIKTDVAWVGPGYSFGLNGVDKGAKLITEKSEEHARPFIISLDGWGGTQRSAAIWSGDQTGGEWEYIRFHIPTYIGLGLSGNPNMGSDMDGIFGGANPIINAREYQWKTFTSIMMNMDGWGAKPKTPFSFDDKTTDLNRISLKRKSTLVPYAYSIGHQASTEGKPIVRAILIDFPDEAINYSKSVQYQYMYGDNLLVAPIYQDTAMQENGDDIRNNIFLPDASIEWIDFYTGEKYQGGQVLNGFEAPLWKIPVFVKNGAIIPMTNPNNNPTEIDRTNRLITFYPHKDSNFTLVEDDGLTVDYKSGKVAKTLIESHAGDSNEKGTAVLTINATEGSFEGFNKNKTTELHVNVSEDVDSVTATINGEAVTLTRVNSLEAYQNGTNVFFYHEHPIMETYNPKSTEVQGLRVAQNSLVKIKLAAIDVSTSKMVVTVNGFINKAADKEVPEDLAEPTVPTQVETPEELISATSITVVWQPVDDADTYDIKRDGVIYTGIKGNSFLFEDLNYGSSHEFSVRAVNAKGVSDWSAVVTAKTSEDPLMNAIEGISATSSMTAQPGQGLEKLFNKQLGDQFHSQWNQRVTFPATITMDLGGVYQVDYLEYHPRTDGGSNGIITRIFFETSEDGKNWTRDEFYTNWARNSQVKTYRFTAPKARYVRANIAAGYNNFVSGEEILIFKKPGTRMEIVGDINRDGKISEDDKTSFLNYTGLRTVDSDFDYIKHVDVNNNGLIDAQDISVIAVQLEGGVQTPATQAPSGRIFLEADKLEVGAGEQVKVRLIADNLDNTNALTSIFQFDNTKYRLVSNSVTPTDFIKQSENFSRVRARDEKTDVVFSFVNFGQKEAMSGSGEIAYITLEALKDVYLDESTLDTVLVANNLRTQRVSAMPIRQTIDYEDKAVVPTEVKASRATQGGVRLSWHKDPKTMWYIVEQEVSQGGQTQFVEVDRTENNVLNVYNLSPETSYRFRVIANNPLGNSEPSEIISVQTVTKDLSHKIDGITATAEAPDQPNQPLTLLFDGDESTQYHSQWFNDKAVPSSMVLDLGSQQIVDHIIYVPRRDAGNGTLTGLTIDTSLDGENWSSTGEMINWVRSSGDKVAYLPRNTKAQFIRLNFKASVGGFISGQELYVISGSGSDGQVAIPDTAPTTEDKPSIEFANGSGVVNEVSEVPLLTSPRELIHTGTGVRVTLETGDLALITGAEVTHKETKDPSTPNVLKDQDYDLFDISLVDAKGNVVSPLKDTLVIMPIDDGKTVAKVVYLPNTDQEEELDFEMTPYVDADGVTRQGVVFVAKHFSEYGIVYKEVSTPETKVPNTAPTAEDKPVFEGTLETQVPKTAPSYELPEGKIETAIPKTAPTHELLAFDGKLAPMSSESSHKAKGMSEKKDNQASSTAQAKALPNTGDATSTTVLGTIVALSSLSLYGYGRRKRTI